MGSYDSVDYWDEHQWYSADVDKKEWQHVWQTTAASFAAEVDNKDDDR
jgi:hypothetical protein